MYSLRMISSVAHRHALTAPLAAAMLGTGLFSLMDALLKGVTLVVGAYNAMFWRVLVGALITGIIYLLRREQWPTRTALRFHAMRSALAAMMTIFFFWGLARTPLAEALALSFIAPLIALYLARALLGEQLSRGAIGATLIGLVGVAVILLSKINSTHRPDALLGAGSILISACAYAYNLILQRQQAAHSDPIEVSTFQNVFMFLLFSMAAPWLAVVPDASLLPPIAIAAVLASISLTLLSWAYGRAEAQYLLPVEYTAFLWAVLFGWWFFGERVAPATLIGALLILGACWLASRAARPEHAVPVE